MPDMPLAAFMEAPNLLTWMTYATVLVLCVSLGNLERKLDRIMKHLGIAEESPKPAPTALQSWARPRSQAFHGHVLKWSHAAGQAVGQVWNRRELKPLRRLVRSGIGGTVRLLDRLLYQTPSGKSPAQDEV